MVFQGGLSVCQPGAAQGTELLGWGRRKQHSDRVSCGWGTGAGQVERVQNLYAPVGAEAEVQPVTPCQSEGTGAEFVGRSEMGRRFEVGRKAQEVGYGSEVAWVVAMLGTVTLKDREVG